MARATILKEFLSKISTPKVERPDCWSVIKVEKMLEDLGINGFEIVNEPRVVKLNGQEELMRMLLHLVPSEVSSDYHLILSKLNNEMKLQIGCWQFEVKA